MHMDEKMRRWTWRLCLLLLPLLLLEAVGSEVHIVYLGRSHSPQSHAKSHIKLLSSVLKSPGAARKSIIYSYTRSFNGFAAQLQPHHVAALKNLPGVVSVFPDKRNELHTTRSWQFMGLEDVAGNIPEVSLWKKSNFGKDVIIGSLDTGIWPESESYKDESFGPIPESWKGECVSGTAFTSSNCNKKIIGARFYVKTYELYNGPLNTTATGDFRSPRDQDGHGTHTSSTAGGNFVYGANILGFANGTAKGGASQARLAIYKVCWQTGCYDADILAAMDDAIADGVNILTLSLGASIPPPYFEDGIAIGAYHATQKGISVVCSAGNSGPTYGSVANVAPWILTVAASSIDREFSADVVLGNNKTYKGSSLSQYHLKPGMYPLASGLSLGYSSAKSLLSLLCNVGSLSPKKTKGKIVVCLRGITSRLSKGKAVKQAGGAGMILANSDSDGGELLADAHVLPATQVDDKTAAAIYSYIRKTRSPLGYISPATTVLGVKPAPVIASFSSQGPNTVTPDILKPDITAPGLNILASFSEAASSAKFAMESGTSMSCPHVAGIVALLKSLHPEWSPAAIKSAIMTTAINHDNTGQPITGGDNQVAGPFNYGAGHVNPNAAAEPGLIYDTTPLDYNYFLCSLGYSSDSIEALTGSDIACPSTTPITSSFNYPTVTICNLDSSTTIIRTLTNVEEDPSSYQISITPPPGISVSVNPSILNFSGKGDKKSFSLTFTPNGAPVGKYVFGYFIWSDGKHQVKSPISVKNTLAPYELYSSL